MALHKYLVAPHSAGCTERFMLTPHISRLIFAYAYTIIYACKRKHRERAVPALRPGHDLVLQVPQEERAARRLPQPPVHARREEPLVLHSRGQGLRVQGRRRREGLRVRGIRAQRREPSEAHRDALRGAPAHQAHLLVRRGRTRRALPLRRQASGCRPSGGTTSRSRPRSSTSTTR